MSYLIHRQVGRDDHYKIWHTPEQNMFIFIQAGSGSVVSGDKSYPMKRGTLCFIGKRKYHYTFPDIPEQYIRSKLFVSSDELERVARLLSSAPELCNMICENHMAVVTLSERNIRRAEEIFKELSELSDEAVCFQAKLYASVLELVSLLAQSPNEKTPTHFDNIQAAVEYINLHITEDIIIDRICDVTYMSKYYFCRLFKKKMGLTVMEYVLKTRIAMAKDMLSNSELSVTEISENCGFSSISYFSRVFKNETGMTPLQYKRSRS